MKGSLVIMNVTPVPSLLQSTIIQALNDDHAHEFSVMVKDSQKKHMNASHVSEKAQNYFMFIATASDVNGTVHQWSSLPTWNPLAQVVVVFTEPFSTDALEVETRLVLRELLDHKMLNVNIVSHRNGTNVVQVVSWYPYENTNCATEILNLRLLDECIFEMDEEERTEYYPKQKVAKIPSTLHGCPLRVSSGVWEPYTYFVPKVGFTKGFEVLLIQTVSKVMHMNPVYELLNETREDRQSDRLNQGYTNLIQGYALSKYLGNSLRIPLCFLVGQLMC